MALNERTARLLGLHLRSKDASEPRVVVDDVTIEVDGRRASVDGQPLDLTRHEVRLLRHLLHHRGQVLSRADLLAAVWWPVAGLQPPMIVSEYVRRLRGKLEAVGVERSFIETVPGVGYRVDDGGSAAGRAAATMIVAETEIVLATKAARRLLGAGRATDLVGRDVFEVIAPRSVAAINRRRAAMLAGSWPPPDIVALQRVDGSEVIVEVASTPVTWNGVPSIQVTLWPVAGRSQRMRELVIGISDEVSDAVIVASGDLVVETFNPAAQRMYGWTQSEAVGRPITEVLPWADDEERQESAWRRLEESGRWHGIVRQLDKRGRPLSVHATTTLLRDELGDISGAIAVNRLATGPALATELIDADLVDDLDVALGRAEIDVHYQPVVRLEDGQVVGHEALARWRHPTRGTIAPSTFVAAAEASGQIVELGEHVLRVAIDDLARWRSAGHDVHMSVNVSADQLVDARFAEHAHELLAAAHAPPDALSLEVTETVLIENIETAIATLTSLAEHGVRVSIDDFGTGWASLTYLHSFPVHALKIDTTFVGGLGSSTYDKAIARSIVTLGDELDIGVIAEGVETVEQRDALLALGCTVGQGWLFGRAVPFDQVVHGKLPAA